MEAKARFLGVKEVADLFGVSMPLIYKLVRLREDNAPLPKRNEWFPKHQRIGNVPRFHVDEIARAEKSFIETDLENV